MVYRGAEFQHGECDDCGNQIVENSYGIKLCGILLANAFTAHLLQA